MLPRKIARCPRQMALQPLWHAVPPWWRAKVPTADEDELIGMAIDNHSGHDLAMHIFHLGVPILGLTRQVVVGDVRLLELSVDEHCLL